MVVAADAITIIIVALAETHLSTVMDVARKLSFQEQQLLYNNNFENLFII